MDLQETLEIIHSDYELIDILKKLFFGRKKFTEKEKELLNLHITEDYRLMGVIGLILNCKARILLGSKQSFDIDIKNTCDTIKVTLTEMEVFADYYLEDDYSKIPEEVIRNVMLSYPKDVFENEYLKNNNS